MISSCQLSLSQEKKKKKKEGKENHNPIKPWKLVQPQLTLLHQSYLGVEPYVVVPLPKKRTQKIKERRISQFYGTIKRLVVSIKSGGIHTSEFIDLRILSWHKSALKSFCFCFLAYYCYRLNCFDLVA